MSKSNNSIFSKLSKGFLVPEEIQFKTGIKPIDKFLWSVIIALDEGEGCTASNQEFMEFFDISSSTLKRHLQKLKDKKYIKIIKFDGRIRTIKSNL